MASGSGSFIKSASEHYCKLESSERERLVLSSASLPLQKKSAKKVGSQITRQIQNKVLNLHLYT